MESIKSFSIVNKVLFPAPDSSYSPHWKGFPGELLWLPVPFVSLTKIKNGKVPHGDREERKDESAEKEEAGDESLLANTSAGFGSDKPVLKFPCHYVSSKGYYLPSASVRHPIQLISINAQIRTDYDL